MGSEIIWDYEFFKEIVLVLIPVAVGGTLTPIITRKWQTRSAKIKIKKEILESFSKSAQYQKNVLHQFVGLFSRTYGNADRTKYGGGQTSFESSSIPLSGDESPKIKLQDDYKKMNQRYEKSKLSDETVFISLLRLYYRDESIVNEYVKIQEQIGYQRTMVYDLMQDHDLTGYEELMKEYNEKLKILLDALKDFSKRIVEKDITV